MTSPHGLVVFVAICAPDLVCEDLARTVEVNSIVASDKLSNIHGDALRNVISKRQHSIRLKLSSDPDCFCALDHQQEIRLRQITSFNLLLD